MGKWEYLHITHPWNHLPEPYDPRVSSGEELIALERKRDQLRPRWNSLYKETLPALARSKSPAQPRWPVHLDHCFARIILDAVVGNSNGSSGLEPEPWTTRLEAPAIRNIHPRDLERCIELGEAIAEGKVDLVELDRQSLAVRGKLPKGGKRKRGDDEDPARRSLEVKKSKIAPSSSSKTKSKSTTQPDIRTAMGYPPSQPFTSPSPPPPQAPPAHPSPTLTSRINTHPSLTPFRKRVLLALCQVPPGHYTTYLALSNYLHSSPRAVGNALRNNPFAPEAPCHRVVAADGGIGGFGGEWGVQGKHHGEKVRLLRGEGVCVEGDGGKVRGRVWEGFV